MSSLFEQADDVFFSRHPELVDSMGQRQAITLNPSDQSLREEWMEIYRELEMEENEGYGMCDVGGVVQACPRSEKNFPTKNVSGKTMARLQAARKAIDYAKRKFAYGAGNQSEALGVSRFNSYYRMKVARDNKAFVITPEVASLAGKNSIAFLAAKAELSKGGNCGEHANVVFDYLRREYPGENIQIAQQEGFDHAFVIIGDLSKEGDNELVVADAWPTNPSPVLWEDHFAYTSDRKKLLNHASSKGDARDYKQEMLDAGLSLNEKGRKLVEESLSREITKKEIDAGTGGWIWEHPDTYTSKTKYNYITPVPRSITR